MSNDTSKLITPGIKFTCEDGKQYETTGEWRPPIKGEAFINNEGFITISSMNFVSKRPILRELPPPALPRRVPNDADAIHRPRCWVRDSEDDEWSGPMRLVAVLNSKSHNYPFSVTNSEGVSGGCWRYCEIEDVPLGPVYHWRDATSEDVGSRFLMIMQDGRYHLPHVILTHYYFDNTKATPRVLVEVGK
jgi:hypothetical protein